MTDEASEKKYEPSGKRLDDLKRKGQVIRSRDLSGGFLILSSVTILSALGHLFFNQFKLNFLESYGQIKVVLYQGDSFTALISNLIMHNFILLIPLLTLSLISVVMSVVLFGGWNFTLQPLVLNFNKLNPFVNLSNILSMRTVIELFKSLAKFTLVMLVIGYFLSGHYMDLKNLIYFQPKHAIFAGYELIFKFAWSLLITLIFIVSADIFHQYTHFMSSNRMSFQEIKDEHKETDGSMDSKRRQRSAQLSLYKQRLSMIVPKATVIVTNPSHYAVALRYEEGKDKAPKVIAKGKDILAHKMRSIAASHGIPIYPAPPLARALYHTSKLGSEIRADLYMAVAVVLSYVHQLRNYQQGKADLPKIASELSIPSDLMFEE